VQPNDTNTFRFMAHALALQGEYDAAVRTLVERFAARDEPLPTYVRAELGYLMREWRTQRPADAARIDELERTHLELDAPLPARPRCTAAERINSGGRQWSCEGDLPRYDNSIDFRAAPTVRDERVRVLLSWDTYGARYTFQVHTPTQHQCVDMACYSNGLALGINFDGPVANDRLNRQQDPPELQYGPVSVSVTPRAVRGVYSLDAVQAPNAPLRTFPFARLVATVLAPGPIRFVPLIAFRDAPPRHIAAFDVDTDTQTAGAQYVPPYWLRDSN